jgi:twinkle protein
MIERKGDTLIGDSWDELDVRIPESRYSSSMNIKIKNCPECKAMGKKNDYSLSVVPAEGKGKCHKCGVKFVIRQEQKMSRNTERAESAYTPPSRANLTKLSEDGLKYFTNRRISQEAVIAFKVAEENGYVAFPYLHNGELVNIKYKKISEKRYRQSPNGKHVMFNYDQAKQHRTVIICEGEEECMCWLDAGFPYAVSVDSGAPNPKDQIDKKLECFTNCFDLFEQADLIYIATDNDDNGRRLAEEIIRRVDVEKVRKIDFGIHKDANEVVMMDGRDQLKTLYREAKDIRMDGIIELEDVALKMLDMYDNGLPKGHTTHHPSVDERWKWREGEVTIGTGFNNEGKSTLFTVNLPMAKIVYDGWKVGAFVPENLPSEEFFEELVHCYLGKTSDIDYPNHRASREEFINAMNVIKKHVFLIYPEKNQTLEELFKRFDYLVRKHGIRIAIFDPYNQIEHIYNRGETTDLYVSRFMTLLKQFTVQRRLCTILVAHQNPPKTRAANGKDLPKPEIYNIKNGGTFGDKADNVIYAYRPLRMSDESNPLVEFGSDKIKKKKLLMASCGSSELVYDWKQHRYLDPKLQMRSPFELRPPTQSIGEDEMPF